MTESSSDEALIRRLDRLETELRKVETRLRIANRRLRNILAIGAFLLISGLVLAASPTAQAQFGITLASLNTRLTVVENKTAPLSYNSGTKLLTVSGANVMIIDGTGATESTSGLGNLQVGYNALRGDGEVNDRTGSHNLILGDLNNYSISGGLVVGLYNTISGRYASVSGGTGNTASGENASVSGGATNTASGSITSVSGGYLNSASGHRSSVSGGARNTVTATFASISGGTENLASEIGSSVSGGSVNTASGIVSSISGGTENLASGGSSSISGGNKNVASGEGSSILGGNGITLNALFSTYPAGP
ncbi:hypothetical protein GC170_20385 [bacterium]|nr:hypothetical protein [bacterium]